MKNMIAIICFAILATVGLSQIGPNAPQLDTIKQAFDSNYVSITDLIPHIHNFIEGSDSNNIGDGGDDMFDGGNYLGTDLEMDFNYSNDEINS